MSCGPSSFTAHGVCGVLSAASIVTASKPGLEAKAAAISCVQLRPEKGPERFEVSTVRPPAAIAESVQR